MMIKPLKFLFLKKFLTPKNLKLGWKLFQRKKISTLLQLYFLWTVRKFYL